MDTKYGNIPDKQFHAYQDKMIGKIYKLLPLCENSCDTLPKYIQSLIFELSGLNKILFNERQELVTILSILEQLQYEKNFKIYRSQVFQCIKLIKNMCNPEVM